MNAKLIAIAMCLFASHTTTLRADFVVNGSMTGPVGFNTQPAPWAPLFGPVVDGPASTLAAGGLADGLSTLAPGISASPDGGTFLVFSNSFNFEKDYAGQPIAGLVPGATYTLGFYYTNVGATFDPTIPLAAGPGSLLATIAGQTFSTGNVNFAGPGQQTWLLAEFSFQATQEEEHLGLFTSNSLFWGGIDGVFIVPEPSSWVLLSVAMLGLIGWTKLSSRRFTPKPVGSKRLPFARAAPWNEGDGHA